MEIDANDAAIGKVLPQGGHLIVYMIKALIARSKPFSTYEKVNVSHYPYSGKKEVVFLDKSSL